MEELSGRKTEAERKVKVLENQVSEANARLTDDEHHVTELQSVKVKLQKELESSLSQLEEFESKCSTAERAKASLESQLAELQVNLWGFSDWVFMQILKWLSWSPKGQNVKITASWKGQNHS